MHPYYLIGTLGLLWQTVEFLYEFNDWNELDNSSKLGILIFVLSLTVLISIHVYRRFAEINQLAQQLVIMDKIKDEFLTNTSHELRIPLHGGRMGVRSVVGQGVTFYFTLPLTDISNPISKSERLIYNPYAAAAIENEERIVLQTSLPATPTYVDYGGEMHILIVDNDPVNTHIILQLLSSEQYRITTMSHGEEVLSHLVQNKPEWDLVILDVLLPPLSSYEVCRKLREYYSLFELPIIMLTAQSQLGDLKAAFEAGANDYTVKPVNGGYLL